jgi:hypothetical protein
MVHGSGPQAPRVQGRVGRGGRVGGGGAAALGPGGAGAMNPEPLELINR